MDYKKRKDKIIDNIKPLFDITNSNFEYVLNDNDEYINIDGTKINCRGNSINAILTEIFGYFFVYYWKDIASKWNNGSIDISKIMENWKNCEFNYNGIKRR